MSEDILMDSMLIEGFDPEKLQALQEKVSKDSGWKKVYGAYQNNKVLQADVRGIEDIGKMTCAIVMVEDVRGIIPLEYFGVENKRQLRNYIGKPAVFTVKNYDRENEIFTGSRVDALEQMAEITLKRTQVGDTKVAVIKRVVNNGLYADIGGIQVHIPIDQVRFGWIDDLSEEYKEGDHMLVKVMEINEPEEGESKSKTEIVVSAKALQENPWDPDGKAHRFLKGNEYFGKVSGVAEYGVFVNLADGVDSLARHLKFENVKKGDKVLVRILDVDVKDEQIRSRIVRVI